MNNEKMDKVCFIGIIEKEQVPLDVWEITPKEDLNVTQMELMIDSLMEM